MSEFTNEGISMVWAAVQFTRSGQIDGATVTSYGDIPTPVGGYWVGGVTAPLVVGATGVVSRDDVEEWLKSSETGYVGVWRDPADGSVYVDDTEWVRNRQAALRLAAASGEIAVYDIENGCSLNV